MYDVETKDVNPSYVQLNMIDVQNKRFLLGKAW